MNFKQTINAFLRKIPAWTLYVAGPLPAFWWLYLGLTGGLGPEPIKALEHVLGEFGLQLFVVVLAVTPLRQWFGVNLIKFRRALGLLVFFYISCHLAVWLFLDVQIWSQIKADILKRPYITIGMAAFALLVPLAVTSNNFSIRRLGPVKWKRLHLLTYPAAILGGAHYVMLVKGWQLEPLIYFGLICTLLAARIKWPKVGVPA